MCRFRRSCHTLLHVALRLALRFALRFLFLFLSDAISPTAHLRRPIELKEWARARTARKVCTAPAARGVSRRSVACHAGNTHIRGWPTKAALGLGLGLSLGLVIISSVRGCLCGRPYVGLSLRFVQLGARIFIGQWLHLVELVQILHAQKIRCRQLRHAPKATALPTDATRFCTRGHTGAHCRARAGRAHRAHRAGRAGRARAHGDRVPLRATLR
mmetsp:Transcript_19309/g.40356  ORF Transcript_19309/g.40356 Transcript_19309/m.40356 type:complete len:215 (-) Transcript_19309:306-950(-)